MESEEPCGAELVIRPHIAIVFQDTSGEDGGGLVVSSMLEEDMRPSNIERSEDKDETWPWPNVLKTGTARISA